MNLTDWIKIIMVDCIAARAVKSSGQILQKVHLNAPLSLSCLERRVSEIRVMES